MDGPSPPASPVSTLYPSEPLGEMNQVMPSASSIHQFSPVSPDGLQPTTPDDVFQNMKRDPLVADDVASPSFSESPDLDHSKIGGTTSWHSPENINYGDEFETSYSFNNSPPAFGLTPDSLGSRSPQTYQDNNQIANLENISKQAPPQGDGYLGLPFSAANRPQSDDFSLEQCSMPDEILGLPTSTHSHRAVAGTLSPAPSLLKPAVIHPGLQIATSPVGLQSALHPTAEASSMPSTQYSNSDTGVAAATTPLQLGPHEGFHADLTIIGNLHPDLDNGSPHHRAFQLRPYLHRSSQPHFQTAQQNRQGGLPGHMQEQQRASSCSPGMAISSSGARVRPYFERHGQLVPFPEPAPSSGWNGNSNGYLGASSLGVEGNEVHGMEGVAEGGRAVAVAVGGARIRTTVCGRSNAATQPEYRQRKSDLPYAQLIYQAFMANPRHAMTLQEIYQWFRENTDKAKGKGKGWMNSIRHNLSMNAAFVKRNRKDRRRRGSPASSNGERTDSWSSGGKRSSEWVLQDWAIRDGVQSTTRYRKGVATDPKGCNGEGGAYIKEEQQATGSFREGITTSGESVRTRSRGDSATVTATPRSTSAAGPRRIPSSTGCHPHSLYSPFPGGAGGGVIHHWPLSSPGFQVNGHALGAESQFHPGSSPSTIHGVEVNAHYQAGSSFYRETSEVATMPMTGTMAFSTPLLFGNGINPGLHFGSATVIDRVGQHPGSFYQRQQHGTNHSPSFSGHMVEPTAATSKLPYDQNRRAYEFEYHTSSISPVTSMRSGGVSAADFTPITSTTVSLPQPHFKIETGMEEVTDVAQHQGQRPNHEPVTEPVKPVAPSSTAPSSKSPVDSMPDLQANTDEASAASISVSPPPSILSSNTTTTAATGVENNHGYMGDVGGVDGTTTHGQRTYSIRDVVGVYGPCGFRVAALRPATGGDTERATYGATAESVSPTNTTTPVRVPLFVENRDRLRAEFEMSGAIAVSPPLPSSPSHPSHQLQESG